MVIILDGGPPRWASPVGVPMQGRIFRPTISKSPPGDFETAWPLVYRFTWSREYNCTRAAVPDLRGGDLHIVGLRNAPGYSTGDTHREGPTSSFDLRSEQL